MGATALRAALVATALCAASLVRSPRPVEARQIAAPGRGTAAVPRVGLALSGGSAKGFAHVGVLRELERHGVEIDVVTGTSMGSVIGGLYAIGISTDSIAAIIASVDWPTVLGGGVSRDRRFLHQRRFDERAFATVPLQGGIASLAAGAVSGSNIIRLAERATWRAATVRDFGRFPRPFAAVATDIETGEAVRLTGGVLSEAMRASTGIPGAFEPFQLEGRLLVDGALSRNLPASDARALGADFVICSDVSDPLATAEQLGTLVDVLDQVMTLSMRQSMVAERSECDVLVRPDVEGISGLSFNRFEEWFERGRVAAVEHEERFAALAERQDSTSGAGPEPEAFLGDSVRVVGIRIDGPSRPTNARFVRGELRVAQGSYVTPVELASRLSDIDATGLFGLVRYRLDGAVGGAALTVHVREQPRDRLGVGLRYDDVHRAALLFTTTLHNQAGYGSVTRLDLRVGEETRARISYRNRRGITGRFEGGLTVSWSQSELRLPQAGRPVTGIDLTNVSAFLGLVGGRATFLGVEGAAEWAVTARDSVPDVLSVTVTGVFDHESLDRIDFPRSGIDATARWGLGVSDVVEGEDFNVLTGNARVYLPLQRRVTLMLGGFVGVADGPDLPVHRRFYVGGVHPSAVFGPSQPLFHGLDNEELTGDAVQIGRAGLQFEVWSDMYLRAAVDVGGAMGSWQFPMEDPVVGWALGAGVSTLVGPVWLEWSDASPGSGDRLSVNVGRVF